MTIRTTLFAALAACSALPVMADIMVGEPYFRSNSEAAKVGAAFMMLHNHGTEDDTLIGAKSAVAPRIELHTHIEKDGVFQMTEVEGGIPVPAGGEAALMRGGNHVMFMGVSEALPDGAEFPLTLIFEKAGEVEVTVSVDRNRKPREAAHGGDHSTMGH
ncbi:copper chaperone PCu(A)C [Alphaproteobacteria bacterium KMM 3653]|uniref:Copper chaperone PCu(A)C n=1 Tax=Harenicola maris TaxID=2841044 RepID=A0AAP2G8X5_9RHOB|nr:copper chaperone PCu(A)C [Harenicola maris]